MCKGVNLYTMNHTKLLKKENEMEVVTVDPKKCDRWKLADRSSFEFGDMYALAQDILKNGQIEPVILKLLLVVEDGWPVSMRVFL